MDKKDKKHKDTKDKKDKKDKSHKRSRTDTPERAEPLAQRPERAEPPAQRSRGSHAPAEQSSPTGRVLLLPQQPSLLRCGIACHSRSHVSNTSYAKPTVQYHNAG